MNTTPAPSSDPRSAPRAGDGPRSDAGRRSFLLVMAGLVVICTAATVYQLAAIYIRRTNMIGDGENVETYRFDLSNLTVKRDLLVASGNIRDAMPPLDDPRTLTADEVEQTNVKLAHRGAFRRTVVTGDHVVGVALNGQARAYPIRYIRWHEIVNDTVGGVPVAVTYSPLTDSVVVFDRRVAGRTIRFGYSGLLYNSNLLMYDRADEGQTDHVPSLWSQLLFRPIAGPAVTEGHALTVLPMTYTTWGRWKAAHPNSDVVRGDDKLKDEYKYDPYFDYFQKKEIRFPVAPPADKSADGAGSVDLFAPILARFDGQRWSFAPAPAADAPVDPTLTAPTVRALWYAWYAMHVGESGG